VAEQRVRKDQTGEGRQTEQLAVIAVYQLNGVMPRAPS
jgi:hypothetical protein